MESNVKSFIIWASVLATALLLSLVLFLVRSDRKDRFVLFFPSETTLEWTGEARNIPHKKELEDSVRELLKELALGPIRLRLTRSLPAETSIESVLLRKKDLYIDFSEHLAMYSASLPISFDMVLAGVRKSVFYNFPFVENLFIFVGGYPVG